VAHLGYAHATMTRLWLDEQRAIKRRLERVTERASRAVRDCVMCSDEGRKEQAGAAMDALPPARRVILALRVVAGLSYEQIAASLDCSVSTVRSELHEARKIVRTRLEMTP